MNSSYQFETALNSSSYGRAAYSPPPQDSSARPTPQSLGLPPDLAPTNYIHVKEKYHAVRRKFLLDLSVPRPPASALPEGTQCEDTPPFLLDSHKGSVFGEVWVLRANRADTTAHGGQKPPPARERVHLHFRSHDGSIKAVVVRRAAPVTGRLLRSHCYSTARPSVDGGASPVPRHRCQGPIWLGRNYDPAIVPRTVEAS